MSRDSNFSEDCGYVNIHGQDIKVYVSEKTGEILVPIDELKDMGFRIYKKSQYSKLLIDEKQFNKEFNLHMLQSAQSYMLQNKIAFKENDILESINKCKLALTGNLNEPKKDDFIQSHVIEATSNESITITANLRQPHTNFKGFTSNKSPASAVKLGDHDKQGQNGFDQPNRKSFSPNQSFNENNFAFKGSENKGRVSRDSENRDKFSRDRDNKDRFPRDNGNRDRFSRDIENRDRFSRDNENRDRFSVGNENRDRFSKEQEKPQTNSFENKNISRSSSGSFGGEQEWKKSNGSIDKSQELLEKIPSIEFDKPEHNVLVSFIHKPNCVWVQDIERADKILEIDGKVQEEISKSKKEHVKYALNKVFLAQEDGVWFRCKIIKFKPLTVFFLDYGNTAQVNELRNASEELSKIPGQAIRITFNESSYQPQDNDQITIIILKKFDNGTYQVQVKKDSGSAPVLPEPPVAARVLPQTPTFFTKPQPLCRLEHGQKVMVISQNKGRLALRTRECYDKVRDIEKLLDEAESKAQSIDKVQIGQLVLCKKEKLQRAVVLNIDKSVELEFLDYYQTLKVDLSSLRHTNESLAKEPITYILTPIIKNYNNALADIIDELIVKKSKCSVVLSADGFDLKTGDKLISEELQSHETSDRPMIHQFKVFKPNMGVAEYMFNCFHTKDDVYFSSQDALQDYIECVIITELEDPEPYEPIIGEVCLGYYQGSWSRCVILAVINRRYEVRFIDFGNLEFLQTDQMRKLIDEAKAAPILAFRCQFIGLPKVPNVEDSLQTALQDGESYMINIKKFNGVFYEIEIPSLYEAL